MIAARNERIEFDRQKDLWGRTIEKKRIVESTHRYRVNCKKTMAMKQIHAASRLTR
jgi:hypothetical protein